MGVLQGITEFLPVSSSGHLALFQHFFGMEDIESKQMFFSVMLHFGTLISIFIYYWHDIVDMIREFFRAIGDLFSRRGGRQQVQTPPARRLVLLIIVATLPLFAILPVKDVVESATGNVTFVSLALLATGFLLFFSDRLPKNGQDRHSGGRAGGGLRPGRGDAPRNLPLRHHDFHRNAPGL